MEALKHKATNTGTKSPAAMFVTKYFLSACAATVAETGKSLLSSKYVST